MILRITDEMTGVEPNIYVISNYNFAQYEFHPFIAANKWEQVQIDISNDTPVGIISQLVGTAMIIPTVKDVEFTPHAMKVLCEIFPDNRARIRATYMKDLKSCKELVKTLGVNII